MPSLGVFHSGFASYVKGLHLWQGHCLTLFKAAQFYFFIDTPYLHRKFFGKGEICLENQKRGGFNATLTGTYSIDPN